MPQIQSDIVLLPLLVLYHIILSRGVTGVATDGVRHEEHRARATDASRTAWTAVVEYRPIDGELTYS